MPMKKVAHTPPRVVQKTHTLFFRSEQLRPRQASKVLTVTVRLRAGRGFDWFRDTHRRSTGLLGLVVAVATAFSLRIFACLQAWLNYNAF